MSNGIIRVTDKRNNSTVIVGSLDDLTVEMWYPAKADFSGSTSYGYYVWGHPGLDKEGTTAPGPVPQEVDHEEN